MAIETETGTGSATSEKLSGIYTIANMATGKVYVGSAVNLKWRIKSHLTQLRRGEHHSQKLQRSWIKHGEDNFLFRPLLICAKQDLLFFEQRAIDVYRSASGGYNMNPTAGSSLGAIQTDECKEKVAASKRGVKREPFSNEWRKAMSAAQVGKRRCLGYKHTEQARANMRARIITPETKSKISESLKGNINARGFKHSDKTRAKVSAAGMGRKTMLGKKLSEETKRKIGAFFKGKPKPPETRARMSESAKRIWAERRAV